MCAKFQIDPPRSVRDIEKQIFFIFFVYICIGFVLKVKFYVFESEMFVCALCLVGSHTDCNFL